MSILYVRCTENDLLDRHVELGSMRTKKMHLVSSIVLLVVESEDTRRIKYAATVNRAEIKIKYRSPTTAALDITVQRYTKRPATEHDKAYALARSQHKHILTAPAQRAELSWTR